MLNTKKDFINCLEKIINPLKDFYTEGKSGIVLGTTSVVYSKETAYMEGFARVLWGLGPLWGSGCDVEGFEAIYAEGLKNGTDPESSEFWGELFDYDQKIVETAAIGLTLILAPEKIKSMLSAEALENLSKWLYRVNEVKAHHNNWLLFAVLVNLGLKSIGAEYNKDIIDEVMDTVDGFYMGNGWYSDGNSEQLDYYIAFAIHFYTLIYAKVMEREDVERSNKIKERAMLFAKDFIYWFDEDGSAVAFGRSQTYRFAQCCFWSACVFAGIEPFPIGVMKGIISRHLEYWMSLPIFDNAGILSIGYGYPNLNMSEQYNAPGSPYWALKSFLFLALSEDHPFYTTDALPLPELSPLKVIKEARMAIQHIGGSSYMLTAGQWNGWMMHHAEKYSKFAYSTKYAFSVPRSYSDIGNCGCDSMLTFVKDGMCFVRRKCDSFEIKDDGRVLSTWKPFSGVTVKSEIIPTEDGHIRKHTVESDAEYEAYDCGFAVPEAEGKVSGNGESVVIAGAKNLNLLNTDTVMEAVKYTIVKGVNELETRVVY